MEYSTQQRYSEMSPSLQQGVETKIGKRVFPGAQGDAMSEGIRTVRAWLQAENPLIDVVIDPDDPYSKLQAVEVIGVDVASVDWAQVIPTSGRQPSASRLRFLQRKRPV